LADDWPDAADNSYKCWLLAISELRKRRLEELAVKHAREDYNRIQDPAGKIGDDEPVFLLRAKDKYAPMALIGWIAMQLNDPNHDGALIDLAVGHVRAMQQWQAANGCKVPDL
jgi:hypothetical protein